MSARHVAVLADKIADNSPRTFMLGLPSTILDSNAESKSVVASLP